MKKSLFLPLLLLATTFSFSQDINKYINAQEAERIEKMLASDEMRGRKIFSPELDKAADFIAAEFKTSGLQTWAQSKSFRQEFFMIRPKFISAAATLDGVTIDPKNVMVITCQPELKIDQGSGYEIVVAKKDVSLSTQAGALMKNNKNYLVLVDTANAAAFPRLSSLKRAIYKTDKSLIFILGANIPSAYQIEARHEISEDKLANVVGMIPGKSKKDEYVIFSGHYDHLGVSTRPTGTDSIYNGANDDASGVTAMMMLARYFKALKNNERTLIFVAFTGEESGGYGARYFSNQFDADKVMAMFNIEMIGTESKWGKNSTYITGFELTDMGPILQKN
ncbi:MAG TPA: M20/M25/M40 family metallo-hydrolase, partial [Chitinophagaceae bacterium]|nr:M20/M25/M40 family metallo-hydrolase [Chitinophagaceae bacterium]